MKNINSIQSLIIAGLMANIDSHRVQEMVEHFASGMDAMRLALYLNGTINKLEDSEVQVTLTDKAARKIYYSDTASCKDVIVTGLSYDFWEDRVRYTAKCQKVYYFNTPEEADEYGISGKTSKGSYWKHDDYTYEAWHELSTESSCSLEQWQDAVAAMPTHYDLAA